MTTFYIIGGIIMLTVVVIARKRYNDNIRKHSPDWFSLPFAVRGMLGVADRTTETGFFNNKEKKVALSSAFSDGIDPFSCGWINDYMIPEDVDYVLNHRNTKEADELYENTGFYPKRVAFLLRMDSRLKDLTDFEWRILYDAYSSRFDAKMAEVGMVEMTAQEISDGYHRNFKAIKHAENARSEVRSSISEQWDNEFAKLKG